MPRVGDSILAVQRKYIDVAIGEMLLDTPDMLRREIRAYLSRQVDHKRMKRTQGIPQLETIDGEINQLECSWAEFSSGARLAHVDRPGPTGVDIGYFRQSQSLLQRDSGDCPGLSPPSQADLGLTSRDALVRLPFRDHANTENALDSNDSKTDGS